MFPKPQKHSYHSTHTPKTTPWISHYYLRIVLVNDLAILRDLLLAGHDAVKQLDRVVAVVQAELPRVLVL